jgi:hypothetical protein
MQADYFAAVEAWCVSVMEDALRGSVGEAPSLLADEVADAPARLFTVVDFINKLEAETRAGRRGSIADHLASSSLRPARPSGANCEPTILLCSFTASPSPPIGARCDLRPRSCLTFINHRRRAWCFIVFFGVLRC